MCGAAAYCTGESAECPPATEKPNGAHCPWRPHIRPVSPVYSDDAADSRDAASDDGLLSVSAEEAAAWLTGSPQYYQEFSECQGTCVSGLCAPKKTSRGCCHVPSEVEDDDKKIIGSRGLGYWKNKNWFCWH